MLLGREARPCQAGCFYQPSCYFSVATRLGPASLFVLIFRLILWEKPRKSGGRRVGGWGGRLYLPEKKAQRAGPLPFPLREENARQKPPGKTEGLGELNRF